MLDFGLAKAFQLDASDPNLSASPTISLTAAATQVGMVLGTAAYMAPEQASGKPVDKRADVWAFGVVLYEMLTGARPFAGDDVSKTLAHVIAIDPDWTMLPSDVPPVLSTFIRGCLEKEPKERVRDIGNVRLAMKGVFEPAASTTADAVAVVPPAVGLRPVPVAMIVLIAVVVAGLAGWAIRRPQAMPAEVMRFAIVPPDDAAFGPGNDWRDLAISPDGSNIVYWSPATTQLHVRPIDQRVGGPLRGTENGFGPFFSPDGQWVGFMDSTLRVLFKVSIFGGPPVRLTAVEAPITGKSWGADGEIVFGASDSGLRRVSDGGGEPEVLTTPNTEEGERDHRWPSVIPGRDAIVFTINADTPLSSGPLAVLDLATGDVSRLGLAGVSAQYVSTGHLVYAAADGSVRAVPFDVESG